MRIKMRTTAAGPQGVFQADQEAVVSDELGQAFVDGGYAVEVKGTLPAASKPSKPKPKPKPKPKETATRKPPETATLPDADEAAA